MSGFVGSAKKDKNVSSRANVSPNWESFWSFVWFLCSPFDHYNYNSIFLIYMYNCRILRIWWNLLDALVNIIWISSVYCALLALRQYWIWNILEKSIAALFIFLTPQKDEYLQKQSLYFPPYGFGIFSSPRSAFRDIISPPPTIQNPHLQPHTWHPSEHKNDVQKGKTNGTWATCERERDECSNGGVERESVDAIDIKKASGPVTTNKIAGA